MLANLFTIALVSPSVALADFTGRAEPTTAEIANAPTAIEIGGVSLTAVATVYIDGMPRVRSRDAPPLDCQRQGRFHVGIQASLLEADQVTSIASGGESLEWFGAALNEANKGRGRRFPRQRLQNIDPAHAD